MTVNPRIKPRALTAEELEARAAGRYDSFANYLVFCPACGRMYKTNMYVMSAEALIETLRGQGLACPGCGAPAPWTLGYPENSRSGFMGRRE